MKFFWELRSKILKEGTVGTPTPGAYHIEHLDGQDLQPVLSNPPPGARAFFMGDSDGGSGWEVVLPDGTMTKYYVQLPPTVKAHQTLHLNDPPGIHKGQSLQDRSAQTLAELYVVELRRIVQEARTRFG